jgi:hypothetical protein
MTDTKASALAKSGALKLWTERLTPALGPALPPELIHLVAEYWRWRLSWSPALRSKRIVITDADADGFGRSLQFLRDPPFGQSEEPSRVGWYAARSAAPLSELADGSSVFSWAVRVDEWGDSALTVGVALADAKCVTVASGVCDNAFGATISINGNPCPRLAVSDTSRYESGGLRWTYRDLPCQDLYPCEGAVWQCRLTADLTTNIVTVAVEHVPAGSSETSARRKLKRPQRLHCGGLWTYRGD